MLLDYLLAALIIICLYTDLRRKKIYNLVLAPAAALAVCLNFYYGGIASGTDSIKGLLLGMGLLIIPFICGGMGAGDVKLLGTIGAFKGAEFVFAVFLASSLAGGLLALLLVARSGQIRVKLWAVWHTLLSLIGLRPRVGLLGSIRGTGTIVFPYGIAIAAGTAAVYLLR